MQLNTKTLPLFLLMSGYSNDYGLVYSRGNDSKVSISPTGEIKISHLTHEPDYGIDVTRNVTINEQDLEHCLSYIVDYDLFTVNDNMDYFSMPNSIHDPSLGWTDKRLITIHGSHMLVGLDGSIYHAKVDEGDQISIATIKKTEKMYLQSMSTGKDSPQYLVLTQFDQEALTEEVIHHRMVTDAMVHLWYILGWSDSYRLEPIDGLTHNSNGLPLDIKRDSRNKLNVLESIIVWGAAGGWTGPDDFIEELKWESDTDRENFLVAYSLWKKTYKDKGGVGNNRQTYYRTKEKMRTQVLGFSQRLQKEATERVKSRARYTIRVERVIYKAWVDHDISLDDTDGKTIAFLDNNPSNLHPSNIKLIPKGCARAWKSIYQ